MRCEEDLWTVIREWWWWWEIWRVNFVVKRVLVTKSERGQVAGDGQGLGFRVSRKEAMGCSRGGGFGIFGRWVDGEHGGVGGLNGIGVASCVLRDLRNTLGQLGLRLEGVTESFGMGGRGCRPTGVGRRDE